MTSVAFGPKGKTILTGSTDGGVRLHDAGSGAVLHTLGKHEDYVHAVAHAKAGALAASASDDGVFRLWSTKTRKLIRTWKVDVERSSQRVVWALRFDRKAKLLYAALGDGTVRAFDTATGRETRRFTGHTKRVLSIDLDAGSRFLASGSSDQTVRVWNLQTGELVRVLRGHAHTVYAVAWHPGGRLLVSGSLDGTVRIWDPRSGTVKQRLDVPGKGVYGLALDGGRLAAACADGATRLYVVSARARRKER